MRQEPDEPINRSYEGSEGSLDEVKSQGTASLATKRHKRHLSPYQKFKNRAISKIKENEKKIEDIALNVAPRFEKSSINVLSVVEKVAMGREIERVMNMEKEKLSHETQVLKDRMEI